MSIGGHELALCVINEGKGYEERKKSGETTLANPDAPRAMALRWLTITLDGVRAYEKSFGSPGASSFTVCDILDAASELAEYYENHARENGALKKEEDGSWTVTHA